MTEAYYCDNSCAEGVCPKCWLDKGTRLPAFHMTESFFLFCRATSMLSCRSLLPEEALQPPDLTKSTCIAASKYYENIPTFMHACMHTHTYDRKYTHAHRRNRANAYLPTYVCDHAFIPAYAHTCLNVCMYTCVHTYMKNWFSGANLVLHWTRFECLTHSLSHVYSLTE